MEKVGNSWCKPEVRKKKRHEVRYIVVQPPLAGAAAPLVHTGFVAGSYKFYSWLTQKYTL